MWKAVKQFHFDGEIGVSLLIEAKRLDGHMNTAKRRSSIASCLFAKSFFYTATPTNKEEKPIYVVPYDT